MRKSLSVLVLGLVMGSVFTQAGCNSTWVSSGILYQKQDNHTKAANMFRKALWYNETEAAAHFQLAYSLSELARIDASAGEIDSCRDKLSEAFTHYLRSAELKPGQYGKPPEETPDAPSPVEGNIQANYTHYFNTAVRYNESSQTEDAATYFDLAYAADPRGESGFTARLFYVKLKLNAASEADDDDQIQQLIGLLDTLEPPSTEDKADLVNTKATGFLMLGQNNEAAKLYEQLLGDNPNDIGLLQRVAVARVGRQDLTGAAELFERVVALSTASAEHSDQDKYDYIYQAALNYQSAEDYPNLLRMVERGEVYAQGTQNMARLVRMKARAHYQLEVWDQAISAAEKLFELLPDDEAGWQIYYLSLNQVGRTDDALKARERYLELKGR